MKDFNHYVEIYKELLKTGDIREAYVGLVRYVTRLRAKSTDPKLRTDV